MEELSKIQNMVLSIPPKNPLREVFTSHVIEHWRKIAPSHEEIRFRLRVLEAFGSYSRDPAAAYELRRFRAKKAAWDTYLFTAYACNMFKGEKGKDLLGRLRGIDEDSFRSAMAECMVCWFLAGRMKQSVDPRSPGRNGKKLEMWLFIDGDRIGVEVKSPFRERPSPPPGKSTVCWVGDDADKIEQCMEAANKQFSDKIPNLLVIVPSLRLRMFSHRHDIVKAAYGQSKIICPLNIETGEALGPVKVPFYQEGKFLNTKCPHGRSLKPDGFPAYRRISAILCIEEKFIERKLHFNSLNKTWIDHDAIILHNPHAYHPLSRQPWGTLPQLLPVHDEMKWTDGYGVDV